MGTPDFWLTGYTFPAKAFWRAPTVPVRVGDRVENGFHLVQLWMNYRQRAEEIMAFYPPDGYWRARPLPFEEMRWTAYGSSFLIGPVEVQQRPIVDLEEIAFEPETRTFVLKFKRGGTARINPSTSSRLPNGARNAAPRLDSSFHPAPRPNPSAAKKLASRS